VDAAGEGEEIRRCQRAGKQARRWVVERLGHHHLVNDRPTEIGSYYKPFITSAAAAPLRWPLRRAGVLSKERRPLPLSGAGNSGRRHSTHPEPQFLHGKNSMSPSSPSAGRFPDPLSWPGSPWDNLPTPQAHTPAPFAPDSGGPAAPAAPQQKAKQAELLAAYHRNMAAFVSAYPENRSDRSHAINAAGLQTDHSKEPDCFNAAFDDARDGIYTLSGSFPDGLQPRISRAWLMQLHEHDAGDVDLQKGLTKLLDPSAGLRYKELPPAMQAQTGAKLVCLLSQEMKWKALLDCQDQDVTRIRVIDGSNKVLLDLRAPNAAHSAGTAGTKRGPSPGTAGTEGGAAGQSAGQLAKRPRVEMGWEQVAPQLQAALKMENLGIENPVNQACLTATYAHHTDDGTRPLNEAALRELKQTWKLLDGLKREGWGDIESWIHACRGSSDWKGVHPPADQLKRWGVCKVDMAAALRRVHGLGETRMLGGQNTQHYLPTEPANIGLFRDSKFVKRMKEIDKSRSHVFNVMQWLETGVYPRDADVRKPELLCNSLQEWMAVDDEPWKRRLNHYLTGYAPQSQSPVRSALNRVRTVFRPPAPPDEARQVARTPAEKWSRKIAYLAELKVPGHRALLIAFCRELTQPRASGSNEPRPDEPGQDEPEWQGLHQNTKTTLGKARLLLQKLDGEGTTYGEWVGKHASGLEGEALYKKLCQTLKTEMASKPSEFRPFIMSAAARATVATAACRAPEQGAPAVTTAL